MASLAYLLPFLKVDPVMRTETLAIQSMAPDTIFFNMDYVAIFRTKSVVPWMLTNAYQWLSRFKSAHALQFKIK